MEKLQKTVDVAMDDPSRRNFLKGLTALGAGTLLPSVRPPMQSAVANARAIDCHHHFASPAYLKALVGHEQNHLRGFTTNMTWVHGTTTTEYSPAKDFEQNSRQGVATAMLSSTTPGIWFGDPEETRRLARDMNEFATRMASDY